MNALASFPILQLSDEQRTELLRRQERAITDFIKEVTMSRRTGQLRDDYHECFIEAQARLDDFRRVGNRDVSETDIRRRLGYSLTGGPRDDCRARHADH